ncbi:DUF2313 domain-containing protein [Leeia sp. TBRC 13508]|uniref:DUF2313 domain-containing protein n=1 Tax=Leeia speluncae TaxID=2884804 RepID=A0ABS8D283_9NEIS|nr:putative phage tail protein [Leeia speluncae]MCB6182302.1 DUF2313 domain-containing protein [Leeia speluncae]
MSRYASLLAKLLPPTSYEPNAEMLSASLLLDGQRLDFAEDFAQSVIDAMSPATCPVSMIPDWESVYGLPDPCTPRGSLSISSRRQRLIAKEKELGGLSKTYFIALAASIGFQISITELGAYTCEMSCESPVADEGWDFVWQINAPSVSIQEATVEDGVETPLRYWGNTLLECVLRPLRPAHTILLFAYA